MSKRIDTIHQVCKELKETIIEDLDNGYERTIDDINELTIATFKRVAKERGITEGTVRDACTRRLHLKTADFYNALKRRINDKDDFLVARMCSCKTDEDTDMEIERKMADIF